MSRGITSRQPAIATIVIGDFSATKNAYVEGRKFYVSQNARIEIYEYRIRIRNQVFDCISAVKENYISVMH